MSGGCRCERLYSHKVKGFCRECLGHFWSFQGLSAGELEVLLDRAMQGLYPPGESIFHQGDPVDRMFLIKAGRVRLEKVFEDGSEILLDIRKAGDFLGEQLFSEDKAEFPVSTVCMEETLTCGFTRDVFEQLVWEYPNIGLQVIRNMSRRIDSMSERLEGMSAVRLEDRVYNMLSQIAREHGHEDGDARVADLPLTHEDLAFLLGAHRVSITRAMHSLREAGRIEQRKQGIVLF